jgi:hypothetical protein
VAYQGNFPICLEDEIMDVVEGINKEFRKRKRKRKRKILAKICLDDVIGLLIFLARQLNSGKIVISKKVSGNL